MCCRCGLESADAAHSIANNKEPYLGCTKESALVVFVMIALFVVSFALIMCTIPIQSTGGQATMLALGLVVMLIGVLVGIVGLVWANKRKMNRRKGSAGESDPLHVHV